jgi:hypothetical protein
LIACASVHVFASGGPSYVTTMLACTAAMHAKPSSKPEIQQASAHARVRRGLVFRFASIAVRAEHFSPKVVRSAKNN